MTEQPVKQLQVITKAAAIIAILQGFLLFAGIKFDSPLLVSVIKGAVGMNPLTALSFIASGGALLLVLKRTFTAFNKFTLYFLVLFIFSSGFFRLVEFVSGLPVSLAGLFSYSWVINNPMAPLTAFNFVMLGVVFLLLAGKRTLHIEIAQIICLIIFFISLLIVIGYLYNLFTLSIVNVYLPPMALNTAIVFIMLSIASLFVNREVGFMRYIAARSHIGSTSRKMLIVLLFGTVLFGWLRLFGERMGLYDAATGTAVNAWVMITVFFALIIISTRKFIIEESKKENAERLIAENEAMLRSIIDNSPSAIYIKDLNGRFIMVNRTTEKNHRMPGSKIIGKTLFDLFPGNPDAVKVYVEHDNRVIETGQTLEFEETAELEDGMHVYLSQKFPLFDLDNKIYASCGISTDISYRKKNEDKFVAILESAPDAIIIVDRFGIIQLVNQQTENLFGYMRSELLGQNIEILVPDELRSKHVNHREGFFNNHSVRPMGSGLELFGRKKDGGLFPVEISLSPMDADDGLLVSAAIRDITDRKTAEKKLFQLNRQLEESNKELESFSYSVSHDLRAPLRHVIGFGEKLSMSIAGQMNDNDRRLLKKITDSAEKMGMLIDDLLMFSRVGRTEISKSIIDMNCLFREVINEFKEDEKNMNIQWVTNDLYPANADNFQIRIVISNLISNAVKYTSKNESRMIEIGSSKNENGILYSVKDNGTGFDMKYSNKLFGVFQRMHTEKEFEGTGIGLATVQRIVNRHGGKVWAESEQGNGAAFYFSIPE